MIKLYRTVIDYVTSDGKFKQSKHIVITTLLNEFHIVKNSKILNKKSIKYLSNLQKNQLHFLIWNLSW